MKLESVVPMIAVKDIERSHAFYTEQLGFEPASPADKIAEWRWSSLKRDGARIMLSETERGHVVPAGDEHYFACLLYFYPDDVQSLYAEFKAKGLDVTEMETTFYGMREFSLRDPDGHLLSFGRDAD